MTIVAVDSSVHENKDTLSLTCFYTQTTVDSIPQVITLISPADSSTVSDSIMPVLFTVTDISGIAQVTVNDCTVTLKDSLYVDTLILLNDTNEIAIIAIDASSNANSDTVKITIFLLETVEDTIPPVLSLLFPKDSSTSAQPDIEIRFRAYDESGISSMAINGKAVVSPDSIYTDSITLSPGRNTVTAIAVDDCPNANVDTLAATFYYDSTWLDTTPPVITLNAPSQGSYHKDSAVDFDVEVNDLSTIAWVIIAGDTVQPSRGNYTHTVTITPGENSVVVKAQDNATNNNLDSLIVNLVYDNQAPSLRLVNPALDSATIGSSSKRIEVFSTDNYTVKSVAFQMGTNSFTTAQSNDSLSTQI